MMKVYLITYDLNRPGQKYDLLYQAIKGYTHSHFMQNAWIIHTNQAASEVRDHLQAHIDTNDKLFVSQVREAAWKGLDPDLSTWIIQEVAAA